MSPRVRDLLSFISVDSNATFLSIDLLKSSQTINLKCRLSFVTWHWKGMSHTDRSEAFLPVIVFPEKTNVITFEVQLQLLRLGQTR